MKNNQQYYLNKNKCVSLPHRSDCDYLKISNFLSEYETDWEKQQVLDNLGITQLLNTEIQKIVEEHYYEFQYNYNLLDDRYVKKDDVYYPKYVTFGDTSSTGSGGGGTSTGNSSGTGTNSGNGTNSENSGSYANQGPLEPIQNYVNIVIDNKLSVTSVNPVQNKVITAALATKANVTDLENLITLDNLSGYLSGYQRILEAGYGIKIEGNKISTNLDLNPFIITDSLPQTGVLNKIYLAPDPQSGQYSQHIYTVEEGWKELGVQQTLEIDLSGYLSKTEASQTYLTLETEASRNYLTLTRADTRYLKKGEGGVSYEYLRDVLKYYLKKSDVPYEQEESEENPSEGGSESGSGVPTYWEIDYEYVVDEVLSRMGNASQGLTIAIDNILNENSSNVVTNKAIVQGLNLKQNLLTPGKGISINNGVISTTIDISTKQDALTAGDGITIENGVISSTFDTSVYEFIDVFPENPSSNKLYLRQENGSDYRVYIYVNDQWRAKGLINLGMDVSKYLNKTEASETYLSKTDASSTYATKQELSGYTLQLDNTLSSESENAVQNKVIYAALQTKISANDVSTLYVSKEELSSSSYVSETYLSQNYVSKTALTEELSSYTKNLVLKTINGNSLYGEGNIRIALTVDATVTSTSNNAVSGKAVYNFVTSELQSLQSPLTAGYGIKIEDDVISVTLDSVNPFIIADSRPNIQDAIPNKLYLIKDGQSYKQYQVENGEWVDKGTLDFNIDLSEYLKVSDASSFLTSQDIINLQDWTTLNFVEITDLYTIDNGTGSTPSGSGSGSSSGSGSGESGSGSGSGESINYINPRYTTNIQDTVRTNVAVGNIPVNTAVTSLKNRTFSELFDMILFNESWNDPNYHHTLNMSNSTSTVKVGSVMEAPSNINLVWNSSITPQGSITSTLYVKGPNDSTFVPYEIGNTYDAPGNYIFKLDYSYPTGYYTITSNYGNTRQVTVPSNSGSLQLTIKATYPWYLNEVEQTLVPINNNYSETDIQLTGSPSIAIPGENSTCTIQADLGLGYMNVNWTKTTEVRNGVTYSVWTKPDSYLQSVKHKITFNIYMT